MFDGDELFMKLPEINLFITDVDGTLTDGGMYYDDQGHEWKKFNTRDGKGISMLREKGIKVMFLTSEDTPIVEKRAEKLNIDYCLMGIKDKKAALDVFFKEHKEFSYGKTAYIGDDINDLEPLKAVAFSAAPADAMEQNLSCASYVCKKNGGAGCVREVCELILWHEECLNEEDN